MHIKKTQKFKPRYERKSRVKPGKESMWVGQTWCGFQNESAIYEGSTLNRNFDQHDNYQHQLGGLLHSLDRFL